MYASKPTITLASLRDGQLLNAVTATKDCEQGASGAFALVGTLFPRVRTASIFPRARNLNRVVEQIGSGLTIKILVLNMRRRDWPPAEFFEWICNQYPNTDVYRVMAEGLEKWTLSEVMEQIRSEGAA